MPKNENWKGKAETPAGFQISTEPLLGGAEPDAQEEQASKFASGSAPVAAQGEPGELPRSYETGEIFLIAQDPHRLFTYWDIDVRSHPGGPAVIRCRRLPTMETEIEFEVPFEARNWYIPVTLANTVYEVEIGYYREGEWNALGKSLPASTPADALSAETEFEVATRLGNSAISDLLASMPASLRANPELLMQLLEWRRAGGPFPESLPVPDAATARSLRLLRELLGASLLGELLAGGESSESLSSKIFARLGEGVGSAGASELLAEFQSAAAGSSLFSGLFVELGAGQSSGIGAAGSELLTSAGEISSASLASWAQALTSWGMAARSAAASEWLASWGVPGGESSGGGLPTSWLGALGASWGRAVEAWSGSALSSQELAESASWFQAVVSSWMAGETTSWPTGGAEALSSWMRETVSSGGAFGSGSWESPSGGRDFFMHVNAEVIFYGGTHPDAKLTINECPVPLDREGKFRFHFVFPDGVYEIPIVAVSPDGMETRKAALVLRRSTEKTGKVDDSPQPPLAAPMGSKGFR